LASGREARVSGKPTDDTIALVAFLSGGDWMAADEIRHAIGRLGFRRPTSQWVVSRLNLMVKESAPRFERREVGNYCEYSVTGCAHNGLSNEWKGFTTRDYERRLAEISTAVSQFGKRREVRVP
jgi:hypothetical protein